LSLDDKHRRNHCCCQKDASKSPVYIAIKLQDCVEDVESRGLDEVRKIPGYHDEPLSGELRGFRSIRLNKAYRAYYRVIDGKVRFVSIERVDKHEY